MGGCVGEEDAQFFDAREEITSVSDVESDVPERFDSVSHSSGDVAIAYSASYEVWSRNPMSIDERRNKFLRWMETGSDRNKRKSLESDGYPYETDRVIGRSEAVLRKSLHLNGVMMCRNCSGKNGLAEELGSSEHFLSRDGPAHEGIVTDIEEIEQDEKKSDGGRSDHLIAEGSRKTSRSSISLKQLIQKDAVETHSSGSGGTPRTAKKGWLNKLRTIACVADLQGDVEAPKYSNGDGFQWRRGLRRVKVRQCGKRTKELSALYMAQDIQAHRGPILTMKFSPDGQFLASAGEDGIVLVWQIVEDDRSSNEHVIPEIDPTCLYFTVNHFSKLKPVFVEKEKNNYRARNLKKTSDSACVVLPPKVFRIAETPLHEFKGHSEEILDLSWSNNHHLLSAADDKTVRLWKVGFRHCLKVFPHSNYVTSVQFNPVDCNYFSSGSIDGKVRIWAISSGQVVDWTDSKDIVTAVCYRPDGQGVIVGSMEGNCRFYNISDSHLQLEAQISLSSKKKSSSKRITGFHFSPEDSSTLMATFADSRIRILKDRHMICKYKVPRSGTPSDMLGCFTSDGKHIVSTYDNSIYLWNSIGGVHEHGVLQMKKISSHERFSANASLAVPWSGMKALASERELFPFSSPGYFSLRKEYFLDSFPKGSATWPEEKLPPSSTSVSSSPTVLHGSHHHHHHHHHHGFFKASCHTTTGSHTWNLVIVTAGWDGRIRSFHNYGLPAGD